MSQSQLNLDKMLVHQLQPSAHIIVEAGQLIPHLLSAQLSTVSVFGKFTKIIDGNPEGVGGATATAQILWPDGTSDTMTTTTTSDGLAVFPVAIKPSAINKLVTINIEFTLTSRQHAR